MTYSHLRWSLTYCCIMLFLLWHTGLHPFWISGSGLVVIYSSLKKKPLWKYKAPVFWSLLCIPIFAVFMDSNQSFATIIRLILQQMALLFFLMGVYLLLSQQQHKFNRRIRTLFCSSVIAMSPFLNGQWLLFPFLFCLIIYLIGLSPNSSQRLVKSPMKRTLVAWVGVLLLIYPMFMGFQEVRQRTQGLSSTIWAKYFQKKTMKGFNPLTELGSLGESLSEEGDGEILVRVKSPVAPTYLRGMSYQRFFSNKWILSGQLDKIQPVNNRLEHQIYDLRQQKSEELNPPDHSVVLHEQLHPYVFYDMNSSWVGLLSDFVAQKPGRHLEIKQNKEKGFYYFGGNDPDFYTDSVDIKLKPALRDSLQFLLKEIGGPEALESPEDVKEWLNRLGIWFTKNYQYSYDVPASPDRSPILAFLYGHKQGFCEYFATAGVLLARAKGIPARFAKGFAYPEMVSSGEWHYYRKNAHAWMEVYDTAQGWHVYDPTPSRSRPQLTGTEFFKKTWNHITQWFQDIGIFFNYGLWKITMENIRLHFLDYFMEYLLGLLSSLTLIYFSVKWLMRRKQKDTQQLQYKSSEEWLELSGEISQFFTKIDHPCPEFRSFGQHYQILLKKGLKTKNFEEIGVKISEYEQNRFR